MNIRGRICLKHTMYWAILSIAFVYVIHPGVDRLLHGIPEKYLAWVGFGVLTGSMFRLFRAGAFTLALSSGSDGRESVMVTTVPLPMFS